MEYIDFIGGFFVGVLIMFNIVAQLEKREKQEKLLYSI